MAITALWPVPLGNETEPLPLDPELPELPELPEPELLDPELPEVVVAAVDRVADREVEDVVCCCAAGCAAGCVYVEAATDSNSGLAAGAAAMSLLRSSSVLCCAAVSATAAEVWAEWVFRPRFTTAAASTRALAAVLTLAADGDAEATCGMATAAAIPPETATAADTRAVEFMVVASLLGARWRPLAREKEAGTSPVTVSSTSHGCLRGELSGSGQEVPGLLDAPRCVSRLSPEIALSGNQKVGPPLLPCGHALCSSSDGRIRHAG